MCHVPLARGLDNHGSDISIFPCLSTFRVIALREQVATIGALRGVQEALPPVRIIDAGHLLVRLEFELLVRLPETGRFEVKLALRRRRRLGPVIVVLAGVSGHPVVVIARLLRSLVNILLELERNNTFTVTEVRLNHYCVLL